MISVDQDELGIACRKIKCKQKMVDVLVKPLTGARAAVCIFNKGKTPCAVTVLPDDVANAPHCNLPRTNKYLIKNCWTDEEYEATEIKATVQSHGTEVFIVKAAE